MTKKMSIDIKLTKEDLPELLKGNTLVLQNIFINGAPANGVECHIHL